MVNILCIKSVTYLHIFQFHCTTKITGFKLIHCHAVGTCTAIKLSNTLLRATIGVNKVVAGFKCTADHLKIVNLANMRLYRCLIEEY